MVGVDYDTDMEAARAALQAVFAHCDSVSPERPTEVKCIAFGGSSIDFQLMWWTGSEPKDQRHSYDEVAFAVKKALDEAGITIPFPQTTLSFRPEQWPVRIGTGEDRQRQS